MWPLHHHWLCLYNVWTQYYFVAAIRMYYLTFCLFGSGPRNIYNIRATQSPQRWWWWIVSNFTGRSKCVGDRLQLAELWHGRVFVMLQGLVRSSYRLQQPHSASRAMELRRLSGQLSMLRYICFLLAIVWICDHVMTFFFCFPVNCWQTNSKCQLTSQLIFLVLILVYTAPDILSLFC